MNSLIAKPWFLLGGIIMVTSLVLGWEKLGHTSSQNITLKDQIPQQLTIGNQSWSVMGVAQTEAERTRGLSFRDALAPHTGLLFVFSTPGMYSFWMKDMRFPLDIIFLREGRVDSIARHREPGDLTPIPPTQPITEVFEVNAGEAAQLSPGMAVQLTY